MRSEVDFIKVGHMAQNIEIAPSIGALHLCRTIFACKKLLKSWALRFTSCTQLYEINPWTLWNYIREVHTWYSVRLYSGKWSSRWRIRWLKKSIHVSALNMSQNRVLNIFCTPLSGLFWKTDWGRRNKIRGGYFSTRIRLVSHPFPFLFFFPCICGVNV